MSTIWRFLNGNSAFLDGALAGVLLSPLKLASSLVLGLAALLLCAWIFDWTFAFKVWPQEIERLRPNAAVTAAPSFSSCVAALRSKVCSTGSCSRLGVRAGLASSAAVL